MSYHRFYIITSLIHMWSRLGLLFAMRNNMYCISICLCWSRMHDEVTYMHENSTPRNSNAAINRASPPYITQYNTSIRCIYRYQLLYQLCVLITLWWTPRRQVPLSSPLLSRVYSIQTITSSQCSPTTLECPFDFLPECVY